MNRFLVVLDLISIIWPNLHSGHSTSPFFGEFVPRIIYFLSFDDQDRYPLVSKYCMISFLKMSVFDFVAFTTCLAACTIWRSIFFEGIFRNEFTKTIFIGNLVSDISGKGLRSWCW